MIVEPIFRKRRSTRIPVYLSGAIILAVLPLLIQSNYWVGVVNLALIYSIAVLGLNIILGLTGQLNLAQAAFWGIGAYTAAILNTRLGWPFWATFLAAPLVAAVFGVILGFPTLRLAGRYLALATLGFGMIVSVVEDNWKEFTGGVDGIPGISAPVLGSFRFSNNTRFYYLVLACLILATLIQIKVQNSRLGRALRSIKEDELAAELSGVNTFKYRIIAFALCSAYGGLAGQLFAHGTKYVSADAFYADISILFVCMVMIGGAGSIAGPIVGALLLTFIPECLRFLQGPWAMAIFGLVIIVVMRWMPDGLVGLAKLMTGKMHHRRSCEGPEKAAQVRSQAQTAGEVE